MFGQPYHHAVNESNHRGSERAFRQRLHARVVMGIAAFGVLMSQTTIGDDAKPAGAPAADYSKRGAVGIFLFESEDHVLVSKVVPKSPAEKAGLRVGDEIRYVNNERTHTAKGLMDEIGSFHPGTQMEVVFRRAGEHKTIKIEVASYASLYSEASQADAKKPASPAAPANAGMSPETARRMRLLEQQIARLQQELDQLKTTPYVAKPAPPTSSFDINAWLDQHRRGENSGDPSLFQ